MWTRRRFIQAALASGLGACVPVLGGCSREPSVGAIRDALAALRSQQVRPPSVAGYVEFRGVVHAHSNLSHDSTGTPQEVLEAARLNRLDFLVVTDHYTPRIFTEGLEGRQGAVLVVRGVEIALGCTRGGALTRRCASVLAVGLREPLVPGANEQWDWDALFQSIQRQGALSIIAHPRGMMNSSYFRYADGMEIYDIADTVRDRLVDVPRFLLDFAVDYADSRDEIVLPLIVERSGWNLAEWDRFTKTRRFIGLAGNDAHQNLRAFGRYADPYALSFKAVNTHVLAASETAESLKAFAPGLTTEKLVAALRAGRAFAAFNLLADATGFRFAAHAGDGGAVIAVLGDEVPMQAGLTLVAQSPVPGLFELLRDGVPIRRREGRELRHRVDRTGVYRVEVSLKVVDRWRPWIFANPIYVRA
ncbi:MAG: hypothetical protein EPO02_03550 [Nitrospirae bacterium]|nr:MAG: hypothetical protein EPO02_03550 [Nitrospirota bacterium]